MRSTSQWSIHSLLYVVLTIGLSKQHYKKIILNEERAGCNGGGKSEIQLGREAAILIFDESSISTYSNLKKRNLECHFELENLSEKYGFHFYFEEINMNSKVAASSSLVFGDSCRGDYVQFGRDTFGIHTFTSKKYCGRAQKVDYLRLSPKQSSHNQGNRMYIENQDDDVDVYFKVERREGNNVPSFNRTLILVVTIFKKDCNVRRKTFLGSRSWRKCKYTNYCVPEKYFCDQYSNCGWGLNKQGVTASDEDQCLYEAMVYNTGFFRRDNIPINIIVIVIVLAIIVLMLGVCKRIIGLYRVMRPSAQSDEEDESVRVSDTRREHSLRSANNTTPVINHSTSLISETNSSTTIPLEQPPSYDEVVKTNGSNPNRESTQDSPRVVVATIEANLLLTHHDL